MTERALWRNALRFFVLRFHATRDVADPNHDSTVVRQPGITRSMVVGANWRGRRNECAIAKSMIDPKAVAFGGVPRPLAARAIREPP